MNVTCPYCRSAAKLVTGNVIYPHRPDLASLKFWQCKPCGAFVGTHKNSSSHAPLGTLANATLRRDRSQAHAAFDPLWRDGSMSRTDAYRWASNVLKLPLPKTHIAMMTSEQCETLRLAVEKL